MQATGNFCQPKYSDTIKPDGAIHSDINNCMWYEMTWGNKNVFETNLERYVGWLSSGSVSLFPQLRKHKLIVYILYRKRRTGSTQLDVLLYVIPSPSQMMRSWIMTAGVLPRSKASLLTYITREITWVHNIKDVLHWTSSGYGTYWTPYVWKAWRSGLWALGRYECRERRLTFVYWRSAGNPPVCYSGLAIVHQVKVFSLLRSSDMTGVWSPSGNLYRYGHRQCWSLKWRETCDLVGFVDIVLRRFTPWLS